MSGTKSRLQFETENKIILILTMAILDNAFHVGYINYRFFLHLSYNKVSNSSE